MGVGSSRMSGVNSSLALWTGKRASPYVPFVNFAPIVAGTNGISPIFTTTVDVTGSIGLNLKNWVEARRERRPILNNHEGNPILDQSSRSKPAPSFEDQRRRASLRATNNVGSRCRASSSPRSVR